MPGESIHLYSVDIRNLINITDDKAYFLGTAQCFWRQYALIEVSQNGRNWSVYAYIGPQAGMGICQCFDDDPTKQAATRCWRKFPVTYDRETQQVKVLDYYVYQALPRQ